MILLLVFIFIAPIVYYCYWKGRKLPPGPVPLPIFGNTLAFGHTDMDVQLQKWQKQYGDVHTLWLGSNTPVVCVCDPKMIIDTFIKDAENYADRPPYTWNEIQRGGEYGVVFIAGPNWRENRRFALHTLRNFGLGRNVMQERVLDELNNLIDNINADLKTENFLSIQDEIDLAVGGVISRLMFGYSFGREHQDRFQKAKTYATKIVENNGRVLFRTMEPNVNFYKDLPLFRSEYKRVEKQAVEAREFFTKEIEAHIKQVDLDSEQEPLDFVEAFLRHNHKLEQEGVENHYFSLEQLYGMTLDIWLAGQETSSSSLGWTCVYLIDRQDIQKKLHDELDSVIGSDRIITIEDKRNLHYVNAVVAETQRFCSLVPFNLLHQTSNDVDIGGYHIPAGTVITNQISCVHMDERFFPEPEMFKPERFLDANGKFFQPPEFMPFGVGKRACLGESLARLELFLFTANIFNQFKLLTGPEYKSPKRVLGGTIFPDAFKCYIERRH